MANNKLVFEFDKPFDEVEINGENHKLYYDDESLRKYEKQAKKYRDEAHKFLEKDLDNITEDERDKLEREGLEFVKEFIETFYGYNSWEKLYDLSGRSMINLMPLVEFTLDWLAKRTPNTEEAKKDYYTKKKKKRK